MAEDVQVEIKRGSWLRNSDFHKIDDVSTWTRFHPPDLEEREGDEEITINSHMRPEQLADRVYGESELWWVIAYANDIDHPLVGFAPGTTLRIPDPDYILSEVKSDKSEGVASS